MAKIAFWRTIAAAYLFLFAELKQFFILIGGWIISFIVVTVAMVVFVIISPVFGAVLGTIGLVVIMMGALFAFCVAWHRAILIGEEPHLTPHFGRREWRFLGYSLLISLIWFGVVLAGGLVFAGVSFVAGLVGRVFSIAVLVIYFASIVVAGFYLVRLTLALPAVAVDDPSPPLATAWRRGEGNSLRLGFGLFFCMLPVGIVQLLLQFLVAPPFWQMMGQGDSPAMTAPQAGAQIVLGPVFLILYFVNMALTVGFLSFAYRQLTEGEVPVATPA